MSRAQSTKRGRQRRADAEARLSDGSRIMARFWLESRGETLLASGRVALLEAIDRYGSLSRAAQEMGISYRHAWLLVSSMNRVAQKPLVETFAGGEAGGGSRLTPQGDKLIEKFYRVKREIKDMVKKIK